MSPSRERERLAARFLAQLAALSFVGFALAMAGLFLADPLLRLDARSERVQIAAVAAFLVAMGLGQLLPRLWMRRRLREAGFSCHRCGQVPPFTLAGLRAETCPHCGAPQGAPGSMPSSLGRAI